MSPKEQESYEWFKKELKKIASASTADTYDKGERRYIGNGSMVLFKYPNPKTPMKQLKFFDAAPNPIIIEISTKHILGLNLHWVPSKFREVILKFIIKQNKMKIVQNKKFELDFQPLKEFLKRNGLYNICIKKYLTNRIVGLQYIKYSDWKHIANLPLEKFITHSDYTKDDVDRLIYSHISATRKAKDVRFGRPVK